MPPSASGTISIDQGAGPFHYGDTLTFTVTSAHLQNGHPMVEVALFQDLGSPPATPGDPPGPPDGIVETEVSGPDVASLELSTPDRSAFPLPVPGDRTDVSKPAQGRARLLNYSSKAGQQSVTELDRVEFEVS